MTRSIRFSNSMIAYLLLGNLLQLGIGRAAPDVHRLCVRAAEDAATGAVSTGTSAATGAVNAGTSAANGALSTASGALSTAVDRGEGILKTAGSTALDFGSEATKSVEEMIKAGGRATLAVGNLCNQLFNTISVTLAAGSGYVASGFGTVDGLLNNVPVVGVITGGLNRVASGVSNTVNELSATGRQSRTKMFNELRQQLNQSSAAAAGTATGGGTTANDATAAAATTTAAAADAATATAAAAA